MLLHELTQLEEVFAEHALELVTAGAEELAVMWPSVKLFENGLKLRNAGMNGCEFLCRVVEDHGPVNTNDSIVLSLAHRDAVLGHHAELSDLYKIDEDAAVLVELEHGRNELLVRQIILDLDLVTATAGLALRKEVAALVDPRAMAGCRAVDRLVHAIRVNSVALNVLRSEELAWDGKLLTLRVVALANPDLSHLRLLPVCEHVDVVGRGHDCVIVLAEHLPRKWLINRLGNIVSRLDHHRSRDDDAECTEVDQVVFKFGHRAVVSFHITVHVHDVQRD